MTKREELETMRRDWHDTGEAEDHPFVIEMRRLAKIARGPAPKRRPMKWVK